MLPIKDSQKGVSLLFTILIMSVILSTALGIGGILVQQAGLTEEVGKSVVSYYAADSGVEGELYQIYKVAPTGTGEDTLTDVVGDSSYVVEANCGAKTVANDTCPDGYEVDNTMDVNFYLKSTGGLGEHKRAIEISF